MEFKEGIIPCNDSSQPPLSPENPLTVCDVSGKPAGAQPQWSFVLQSEYRRPFNAIGGEWYLNGLYNYRGETEVAGDTSGRLTTDAYSLLDLYAGLGTDSWTAKIWVKNALDEDAVVVKRAADPGQNYNDLSLVAPRTTGVTLSYRF